MRVVAAVVPMLLVRLRKCFIYYYYGIAETWFSSLDCYSCANFQ